MSEHRTRLERDLYDHDHEDEQTGPSGRRRGPVADWGVGEELFDQMPRRRFGRGEESARPARERRPAARPERGDVPRGGAEDGRRTIRIGRDEDVPSEIAAVTADRDLDAADSDLASRTRDGVAADREIDDRAYRDAASAQPGVDAADRDLDATDAPLGSPPELPAEVSGPAQPARADGADRAGVAERRTVKIEGRPDGALGQARFHQGPQRLRPGRSVGERMGARPDRLAAWAFALGLLLILIAVLTSLL